MLNEFFWILDKVNKRVFIKMYPGYLRWLGVKIDSKNFDRTWISPTLFLDSADYSRITIGKNVTISFDVAILTHDFSIIHAARVVGKETKTIINKEVIIGNNVFIGAKSLILPGAIIGDNCIIGGGTVVRGKLIPNSIYAGNPCKKLCSIEEFVDKYSDLLKE